MKSKALTDTLEAIESETQGERISFGDIVEAINHRGFGPLLIAPALIGVLPTGAIPFMPDLIALFIILVASQLVIGRKHPWIPKKLRDFSFDRKQYKEGYKKMKPYAEWVDGFFHPRFRILTGAVAQKFVALFCVILAILIAILGFVPFAAMLPCMAVLLFGMGLAAYDGLPIAIGFAFMALSVIALFYFWSSLPL